MKAQLLHRQLCLKPFGFLVLDYRHMCRFQAKLLYEQPIVQDLEYIFRLDDDSFMTHNITYDLFQFMKDEDKWYGYMFKVYDPKQCVRGLWNATQKYIKKHQVKPTFFKRWPEQSMFYNNFEISKLQFWKSEEYREYIDYIDGLGGIYYYRWGDAPIKSLGLSLFMPESKMHQFQNIGYRHQNRVNKPK